MENQKNKENFSERKSSLNNFNGFKLLKVSDLYKDVYSSNVGETVNILRMQNQNLKKDTSCNRLLDKDKKSFKVLPSIERLKNSGKSSFSNNAEYILYSHKFDDRDRSDDTKMFKSKLINKNINNNLNNYSDEEINNNEEFKFSEDYSKEILSNNSEVFDKKRVKSTIFKTEFPVIPNIKDTSRNKSLSNHHDNVKNFFCPFCEHCNIIKDHYLENHINSISQANLVINKGFDYIIQNLKLYEKKATDLFNFNDKSLNEKIKDEKIFSKEKMTLQDNSSEDIIESLIHNFPKKLVSNRMTYKVVSNFLDALIEDKVSLENIVSKDILEKIKDSTLPKGVAYEKNNENKVFFDKELESLFDEKSKTTIKNLLEQNKKKFDFDSPMTEEYIQIRHNDIMTNINRDKYSENKRDDISFNEKQEKKFIILFLIFIQILSELSSECKERSNLLYKFFKIYFVEQVKKWTLTVNKMKKKIKYYKELCMTIIQPKSMQKKKIEEINLILMSKSLTTDNLNHHKNLIHDLLNMNSEKREEINLVNFQKELLEKELRFWIYDYDNIRLSVDIRNKVKDINMSVILKYIHDELSHKNILPEAKIMLINSDRFLLVSGLRFYFHEQNKLHLSEIERLNLLFKKNKEKKKKLKIVIDESKKIYVDTIDHLQVQINNFKNRTNAEFINNGMQTDIDHSEMNKIIRNYESVIYLKRLNVNKLTKFIERIKYGCSKSKPLAKKSLLNLIPVIYDKKIDLDTKAYLDNTNSNTFDEVFNNYMEEKFKLKKLVKKHCEGTIMSIILYSTEDHRIDLFRRFLGIGENKINNFILEQFLILIKSLRSSMYQLFEEKDPHCLMKSEICFEIYHLEIQELKYLVNDTKLDIIKRTIFKINDKQITSFTVEKIYEYMLVNRFFLSGKEYLKNLILEYKNKHKKSEKIDNFYDSFYDSNKEFNISYNDFNAIFKKNFKVTEEFVDLDNFFNFYDQKEYSFKIKINDFLEVSLKAFNNVYAFILDYLNVIFDQEDTMKKGIIYLKEFKVIMAKIFINQDEWKFMEYFLNALNGQEKDFITKEELLLWALRNKQVISKICN